MRIGVNLLPLRPGVMGGLEQYFRHTIRELLQSRHEFVFFMAPWNFGAVEFPSANASTVLVPEPGPPTLWNRFKNRWRRGNWGLSLRGLSPISPISVEEEAFLDWKLHPASGYDFDLWFCPFISLEPRPLPIPSVVTIPDLLHESYPEFFEEAELGHRRRSYRPTCEMATEVITISDFSKQQICSAYAIAPYKVHVTHLAVPPNFCSTRSSPQEVRAKYSLPERYIYYPANDWPHKNHDMLLIALRLLAVEGEKAPAAVFSGARVEPGSRLPQLAGQLGVEAVHLGYLPGSDVPALYQGAEMVVFPSLFEGFGMPLLEAMAAGTPVAASQTTSIPEVAADAALYFDPRRPEEIAAAVKQLTRDRDLRSRLIERGRKRAAEFSWKSSAEKTLEVFEQAVRRGAVPPDSTRPTVTKGLMADRWMGRFLQLRVSGGRKATLVVSGQSVIQRSSFYPQRLVLYAGRKKVGEKWLEGAGPFSLSWKLPEKSSCDLTLRAGKTFVPRQEGWSEDSRELSVRLERLLVEHEEASYDLMEG